LALIRRKPAQTIGRNAKMKIGLKKSIETDGWEVAAVE